VLDRSGSLTVNSAQSPRNEKLPSAGRRFLEMAIITLGDWGCRKEGLVDSARDRMVLRIENLYLTRGNQGPVALLQIANTAR
jgi:hypothetical protein